MILYDFRPPKWLQKSGRSRRGYLRRVLRGGGGPKRPPKSKVFGSVFRYLKVADLSIIILLYIRFY